MLEIRKNTFSKSYENSFFREFSRHLHHSFKAKNLTGVLIGSPLCEVDERLQIDALLITPKVVCIIDFKNYKGKVNLPVESNFEFGLWTTESKEHIKGGSSINPFIQLKNQKRRFIEVSNKHILNNLSGIDKFNPFHVVRVVCFQEEIELIGKIPSNEALNFFILDKANVIAGILDIVDVSDKEVSLSINSFSSFKNIFRADLFEFDENPFEDKFNEIVSRSKTLDFEKLHDDQKVALREIKTFLESPESQVFVLQGTINSGKSFLIPFIQDIAYSVDIREVEVFAASNRVAKNLMSTSNLENVNSIYSYIYGGRKIEVDSKNSEDEIANEDVETSEELTLEIVPIKNCDNDDNALFIVDESQLVSDSYHQSIDIVFGTGYLLKDFIHFSGIQSGKRKLIFMGDPFQLQLGRVDESPLNPDYLEQSYKLKTSSFQLLDKEAFSDINRQALTCVQSIKTNLYNSLRFSPSEQFSFLSKSDVLRYLIDLIGNDKDGHILSFSNEEAQKVNQWIKTSVVKSGDNIAANDLVLFNNNISIENENDPFSEPKKIFNGQFASVKKVSDDIVSETIKVSGHLTTLNFREIDLQLSGTSHIVKVLSLENYRLNPKAELSKNELVAYKIILNKELNNYINERPFEKSDDYKNVISSDTYRSLQTEIEELKRQAVAGEKVKGKLEGKEIELRKLLRDAKRIYRHKMETFLRRNPSTKYYKLKNSALLRFGWAMTVHKSMSYKWSDVIFNVDPGENVGKTNEAYFRWLYTGLSRARQKISLINYKSISPFDKTEFKDSSKGVRSNEIFFHSHNLEAGLRLSEFNQYVSSKVFALNLSIVSVEHYNWQERYFIKNSANKEAVVSFSYNGQGIFKLPTIIGGDKDFALHVIESLKRKEPIKSFEMIRDLWRRNEYTKLNTVLASIGINFYQILQSNYKDKIMLVSHEDEIEIELDYGADGMVGFITAKYYTSDLIWGNVKSAFQSLTN